MRKENSEFVTEFITKAGNFKKNRDYFAYVELDDMACWVLADGLDSDPDMLSAEIVTGSIINDFTEKPSLKRRHIKKYIRNANQALLRESRIMKLQSTVLVVVTDYSSVVWGSVGNTRLYHLRKERIKSRSKDHSLAQMMVEAGEIESKELNQHQERNNLTEYLGQEKRVKPHVSKKRKLKDNDVLLMCTSGFWENIKNQEIESALKKATEAQEFVDNLESNMLSKENNNLDNYSMVSLFAEKVFKENKSRKKIYKKIAAILVPILILTGSFFVYSKIKKARQIKASKIKKEKLKLKRSKRASKQQQAGAEFFEKGDYNKALTKYTAAKKLYKQTNKKENLNAINEKVEDTKIIVTARKVEEEGDNRFNEARYEGALAKYKEAKLDYLKVKEYNLKEIEAKIAKIKDILKAIAYEEEGNMFHESDEFSVAKKKYFIALKIYRKAGLREKEEEMKNKIEKAQNLIEDNHKIAKARKIEAKGDELFKLNDFEEAILKYTEAKVIYSELKMTKKVNEIESKIDNVATTKSYNQAKKHERTADMQLKEKEYKEALFNYQQANQIYSKIDKDKDYTRVEKKIVENQNIIKARKFEVEGNELFNSKDFKNANSKYMKAKSIYSELEMSKKVKEIKEKINNVTKEELYNKARDHEELADSQLENEEYDKALFNYKEANKIYSKTNKEKDLKRIEKKLSETKDKKEKFLFFF